MLRCAPKVDPVRYLVDGYNLAHALLDGERTPPTARGMREAVLGRLLGLCRRGRRLTVVFDGKQGGPAGMRGMGGVGRVEVRFAPSADDAIVEIVRSSANPSRVCVVTRDRELAARARQLGARSLGVAQFLGGRGEGDPPERDPAEPPEKYDP